MDRLPLVTRCGIQLQCRHQLHEFFVHSNWVTTRIQPLSALSSGSRLWNVCGTRESFSPKPWCGVLYAPMFLIVKNSSTTTHIPDDCESRILQPECKGYISKDQRTSADNDLELCVPKEELLFSTTDPNSFSIELERTSYTRFRGFGPVLIILTFLSASRRRKSWANICSGSDQINCLCFVPWHQAGQLPPWCSSQSMSSSTTTFLQSLVFPVPEPEQWLQIDFWLELPQD